MSTSRQKRLRLVFAGGAAVLVAACGAVLDLPPDLHFANGEAETPGLDTGDATSRDGAGPDPAETGPPPDWDAGTISFPGIDASADSGALAHACPTPVYASGAGPAIDAHCKLDGGGASSVSAFPKLDKCCHTDDDCTFAAYPTSCCDTSAAVGFAKWEASEFSKAYSTEWYCSCSQVVGCGPGGGPSTSVTTDDCPTDPYPISTPVSVHCVSGLCTTTTHVSCNPNTR